MTDSGFNSIFDRTIPELKEFERNEKLPIDRSKFNNPIKAIKAITSGIRPPGQQFGMLVGQSVQQALRRYKITGLSVTDDKFDAVFDPKRSDDPATVAVAYPWDLRSAQLDGGQEILPAYGIGDFGWMLKSTAETTGLDVTTEWLDINVAGRNRDSKEAYAYTITDVTNIETSDRFTADFDSPSLSSGTIGIPNGLRSAIRQDVDAVFPPYAVGDTGLAIATNNDPDLFDWVDLNIDGRGITNARIRRVILVSELTDGFEAEFAPKRDSDPSRVYVARPFALRKTPFHQRTIPGDARYDYSSISARLVTITSGEVQTIYGETIHPPYEVDHVHWVIAVSPNELAVDGFADISSSYRWVDLNLDGRTWRKVPRLDVRQVKIKTITKDALTVQFVPLIENQGDSANAPLNTSRTIIVDRPYLLQAVPSRAGITYVYSDDGSRRKATKGDTEEVQRIIPAYRLDDYILIGHSSDDSNNEWIDLNVDGRMWASTLEAWTP